MLLCRSDPVARDCAAAHGTALQSLKSQTVVLQLLSLATKTPCPRSNATPRYAYGCLFSSPQQTQSSGEFSLSRQASGCCLMMYFWTVERSSRMPPSGKIKYCLYFNSYWSLVKDKVKSWSVSICTCVRGHVLVCVCVQACPTSPQLHSEFISVG